MHLVLQGNLHHSLTVLKHNIFPSRVSGRGYKIGPVCVCVCVCPSVSALTDEPFEIRT